VHEHTIEHTRTTLHGWPREGTSTDRVPDPNTFSDAFSYANSSRIKHNDNTTYDFIHVLINDVDPADDFIHLSAYNVTRTHNVVNDHDVSVSD
jgi:hypothetical protein